MDKHRAGEILWGVFRTWSLRWQKRLAGEVKGDPNWWALESRRAMGQVAKKSPELSISDLETFRNILLGTAPEIALGARLPTIAWELSVWMYVLKGKSSLKEFEASSKIGKALRSIGAIAEIVCCSPEEYAEAVQLLLSTVRRLQKD